MKLMKNVKIVTVALAVALWYNACVRLYNFLIPKQDLKTTLLMFAVAAFVLLHNDGCIAELLFDFSNSRLFKQEEIKGGHRAIRETGA